MHPRPLRTLAFAIAGTLFAGSLTLSSLAQNPTPTTSAPIDLIVDAHAATTPFPHFWEQTFGSGRAILALRADYRQDIHTVKQATDFQSVRFHGILDDEVGLYDPDRKTKNPGLAAQAANDASVYNFYQVDEIYDGLLAEHVKPYVELSFMPEKMALNPNLPPHLHRPPRRLATQGLQALGRHDQGPRHPPHPALRHRRSLHLEVRSLERTQPRLLGGVIPSSKPTLSSTTTPPAISRAFLHASR